MITNILYEETLSFPIELVTVELIHLFGSIVFEVDDFVFGKIFYLGFFQTYCLTRYGATPGKRLFRLRVLKCDHVQIEDNGELNNDSVVMLNTGA